MHIATSGILLPHTKKRQESPITKRHKADLRHISWQWKGILRVALTDVVKTLRLLFVYKKMGRPEDAIAVYLKCIDIFNAAGEEGEFEYPHDTLATICHRIAELYSGMEKYNEAIDWFEKMFDYVEKRREYSSREDNKSKSLILGVSPYYDVHEINLKYDVQNYLRMTYARPAFKVLFELPRFKELLQKYNM